MTMRNANGQVFQMATTASATKLLSPSSQKGRSSSRPSWSTRTWLTMPLSRWNMNAQVMAAA